MFKLLCSQFNSINELHFLPLILSLHPILPPLLLKLNDNPDFIIY